MWLTDEVWHNLYAFGLCLAILTVYDAFICSIGWTKGVLVPHHPLYFDVSLRTFVAHFLCLG